MKRGILLAKHNFSQLRDPTNKCNAKIRYLLKFLLIQYSTLFFRCRASCVALTTTIAILIQRNDRQIKKSGSYDVEAVVDESFIYASKLLGTYEEVCSSHQFIGLYRSSWRLSKKYTPGRLNRKYHSEH